MSRAARFAWVGAGGFVVQVAALHAFAAAGIPYAFATALAVEVAILHNFLWHERWTWRDRRAGVRSRLRRLGRFHLLNGSVSLAGNLVLMRLLVGELGVPHLAANVCAVVACSLINFYGSDRLVFD